MLKEIFSNNLRFALERQGETQRNLAKHLGVTHQAVQKWIQGQRWPQPDMIEEIARYLNVDPTWLLGGGSTPSSIPDLLRELNEKLSPLTHLPPELMEKLSQVKNLGALNEALDDVLALEEDLAREAKKNG